MGKFEKFDEDLVRRNERAVEENKRILEDTKRASKELRSANREVKNRESRKRFESVLKSAGKLIPKGIKNPDSMVVNRHLYMGGGSSRKRRLF